MITKHKIKIALAACLLLAQNAHAGYFNFPPREELAWTIPMGLSGMLLSVVSMGYGGFTLWDALVDGKPRWAWQAIQEKRRAHVENALKVAQEHNLQLTEEAARKKAEELIPGNPPVPTPLNTRILKGLGGATLLASGAFLSWWLDVDNGRNLRNFYRNHIRKS